MRSPLSDNRSEGVHLGHYICNNNGELHPPYRIKDAVQVLALDVKFCALGFRSCRFFKRLFDSRLELRLATLFFV